MNKHMLKAYIQCFSDGTWGITIEPLENDKNIGPFIASLKTKELEVSVNGYAICLSVRPEWSV